MNEFDDVIIQDDEQLKFSEHSLERRMLRNKMERRVRKTQIWLNRLRILLRLLIVILLIWGGYEALRLPQWYMDKSAFNNAENKSLEIMNNKIVPSYKILAELRRAKVPTVPIYMFETDEIKKNILHLDPVEDVFIRRFWFPARLQVIIQERVPVITIAPDVNVEPIAFFSRDGKLIGRDYLPLDKSYKTVRVLSYGVRGDDYGKWDINKIKSIENMSKALETYSKEKVEYIDFRNPNDVYIKLNSVLIRLGKFDETAFDRIKRIESILPQIKTLDKKIKYVDLRWKDANYIKLDEE